MRPRTDKLRVRARPRTPEAAPADNLGVRTKLSPPEVARRLGVSHEKILTWIRYGELAAIEVSTRRGGRPRYRIDIADLAVFEQRRSVAGATEGGPRRRRRPVGDIIEFFWRG